MLSPAHRLSDAETFRSAVRAGSRAGSRTVVVHLLLADGVVDAATPPRVGLVVSKAVGGAVVRNRVKRRLRHLAREHVSSLPVACVLVVRALPAAAEAAYATLGEDLAHCVRRAQRAAVTS